ncbi:hypothetical protein [Streptomyces cyaneochromogenes]|nr:hypothetical protein [Streptomyces cyaneochromogenes]
MVEILDGVGLAQSVEMAVRRCDQGDPVAERGVPARKLPHERGEPSGA